MLQLRAQFLHALLLCAALVLSPLALRASDAKNAQVVQAQALLDKAEQLSRLTIKGSLPFTFQATVEYGGRLRRTTATFFLVWADDQHWRATAVNAQDREVRVRNAEGIWQPKLPDLTLVRAFGYGMSFPFQRSLIAWNETIEGVWLRKVDDTSISCVRLHNKSAHYEVCLNPTTGLVQSIRYKSNSAVTPEVVEYRNYAKFGDKWVPREVRRTIGGHLESDLRLVRLAFGAQTARDMFSSPPEYEVWPQCEHYDYARPVDGTVSVPLDPTNKAADAIFVVVTPDGKAREVRLINPTGRNEDQLVDVFMKQQYQPAACDGKPVLGYFFGRLSIRANRSDPVYLHLPSGGILMVP